MSTGQSMSAAPASQSARQGYRKRWTYRGIHTYPHPRHQPEGNTTAHSEPGATESRGEWLWDTPDSAEGCRPPCPLPCVSNVSAKAARGRSAARLSSVRRGCFDPAEVRKAASRKDVDVKRPVSPTRIRLPSSVRIHDDVNSRIRHLRLTSFAVTSLNAGQSGERLRRRTTARFL